MKDVKHKNVFIRVGGSVRVSDAVAHLESLGYKNGWTGGFYPPSTTATISGGERDLIGWCRCPDWCEENGYEEIFIPTAKHKHYDLIVAWAKSPQQKIWWRDSYNWNPVIGSPTWNVDCDYHLGEQPPKRKIMIGDVEVAAPERDFPERGATVFISAPDRYKFYIEEVWEDFAHLRQHKWRGLVHLNKEAAIAHAKALIKVGGGGIDE